METTNEGEDERSELEKFFAPEVEESEVDKLEHSLEHRLVIGAMCGVSQDRWEEWRDSMSDEYFAILIRALSQKKLGRLLLKVPSF